MRLILLSTTHNHVDYIEYSSISESRSTRQSETIILLHSNLARPLRGEQNIKFVGTYNN